MVNRMIGALIAVGVFTSCAGEKTDTQNVQKEQAEGITTDGLSSGQQAAINFCNCTHISDSLDREDCYGTWVEGISKDSSIIDTEAKVMGKLMFECNPEETLRVLLLIEE